MTIHLPPDVEASVRQRVQQGQFPDAGEVIREAMRLLDQRDRRIQELRATVTEGFAAIERGEGIELTPELFAERIGHAEERARRGEQPHPDVCP
jgi:antitoxin ParD1/3/4